MSAALINRSLTNARTELEFLYDSEVIDKALYDTLMQSLPKKYVKDMAPWGVDRIPPHATANGADTSPDASSAVGITSAMEKTSLKDDISPPAHPPAAPLPQRPAAPVIGYCKASYNYESAEPGDLQLTKGDRLAVMEHLSPDWWKGYKQGSEPSQAGVFPSNYVSVISEAEFEVSTAPKSNTSEKASYNAYAASPAPPSYNQQYQQPMISTYQSQPLQQQPSYGGYSQFPPPSTNYYPQQQPQQQQQQQQQQVEPQATSGSNPHPHLKKFGSKLGNAAIFGAGATIGSDLVNSIF